MIWPSPGRLVHPGRGEIRCQFIILARKDELTPDFTPRTDTGFPRKDELTPDFPPAVLQEQQDDDGNQDDGLAQRMEHLIRGFADERRGVVDDSVTQPLGEAGFQLPHLGLDAVGGVQGVRVWQQKDDNTRRRPTVQLPERVLVSGPQVGPADVPEVGDFPVRAGLENDVCELLGLDQAAEGAQGVLEILAVGDRRLTDLSGRHLHVLLAQDQDHVVDRQIPRLQLVRVQPDAHAVVLLAEDAHIADALHSGDGVLDMDRGVIAQVHHSSGDTILNFSEIGMVFPGTRYLIFQR